MHPVVAERLAALIEFEREHAPGTLCGGCALDVWKEYLDAQEALAATLPAGPWSDWREVPERDILEVIDAWTREDPPNAWATTHDVSLITGLRDGDAQAVLAAMFMRGMIDGCACGCRGDWNLDSFGMVERPMVDEILARESA